MAFDRILLVGCGNMAGAMLEGWLAGGLDPARFAVFDPSRRQLPPGIEALERLPADSAFDTIVMGVKPQVLGEVASQVEPAAGPETIVLSTLAGVQLATLQARFPRASGVVRLLPNLAVALGKSPIGLAARGLDEAQRAALEHFLVPLGAPEWLAEEQFDLFTALAGSGPGFVYRFIGALAAGAEALGFERERALRTAVAMVEGAAALAAASSHDPATLADRVASPGGTTRAGLDVLDEGEALALLAERTLRAARDRGAQLSRENRN